MLQITNLTVQYRRANQIKTVLDRFNLSVAAGECLGIKGRSGSGKSTLLRAILHLIPNYSGQIKLADQDIKVIKTKALYQKVQLIFQDPLAALHPRQTVAQCLQEPIHNFKLLSPSLTNAIAQVELNANLLNRYPHELSGGQRQRLIIARALLSQAKLLLLDEPTSALDPSLQTTILQLLQNLRQTQGLTYIFVSHDFGVLERMCDRIITIL